MKPRSAEALERAGEIQFEFFRSPGPGGQNVNKVSTGVRLRWDPGASRHVPAAVMDRLKRKAGRKMTEAGVLVIEARRFRSQEKNRLDALRRLDDLIRRAWPEPKPRRPTKPSPGSREKRLEEKKRRSLQKRDRSPTDDRLE